MALTSDIINVVFLIPFASPRAKVRWDIACKHLAQTLKSIQNSEDENFMAVVAGNEKPATGVEDDSRFHFVSTDLELPAHPSRGVAVRLDKLAKINAAWNFAKSNFSPRYVMKLDADDFISQRLVGWLAHESEPGYLIEKGWLWRSDSRYFIQRTETLDRICGSCLIIRSDLADRTGPFLTGVEGIILSEANAQFAARDHYSLVPGSGTSPLLLNDSHQRYAAQFAYLGHKLASLPFAAVAYRTGNPDSITDATGDGGPKFNLRLKLGAWRRTRFITGNLRREFMLP